jgi:D-alanyl-lipoteichoic acid acyltransferase DltB (MBOAT superfamily)
MVFNSLPFVGFFLAFFVIYHLVLRKHDHKLWLIAIGSIAFYGSWSYKFIPFLLGTGIVDYYLARWISGEEDERRRRRMLIISVVMNLTVLGFFKYTNFFLETAQDAVQLFGHKLTVPKLDIIVPLGISFYTF